MDAYLKKLKLPMVGRPNYDTNPNLGMEEMKKIFPGFKAGNMKQPYNTTMTTPKGGLGAIPFAGKPVALKTPTNSSSTSNGTLQKVQSGVDAVTPYISNIINSFRKPPAPKMGRKLNPVSLKRVDGSLERDNIDRSVRSNNLALDNAVDGQTGAAIKGANLAQGYLAKNQSYNSERQANSQIANQEASMNLSVDNINASKEDKYNDEGIGMKMAYQREQSQNIANATDKRIADMNNRDARQLEGQKFNVLSKMYTNGIVERLTKKVLNKDGDLTEEDYNKALGLSQKAFGGKLRSVYAMGGTLGGDPGDDKKPVKQVYKTQAEVDAANAQARNFSKRHNLMYADEAWVAKKPGDPVVGYTDINTGKPYDGRYTKPMPKSMIKPLPDNVTKLEWNSEWQMPYYLDDMGDINYVDRHHYNSPKFLTSKADQQKVFDARSSTAKLGLGGPLLHTPKMRGRLRKIKY